MSRRFPLVLTAVVVAAQAYSLLSIGATYWADSIEYAQLGDFIRAGTPEQIYAGDRYFLYQHLMPGLPLVWSALSLLPDDAIWPVLAITQHAVAAAALVAFGLSLRAFLSPWLVLLGAVATSLHPFFGAFHNALLTESLTSSAILFATAQTLTCYVERAVPARRAVIIAASVILASLFRSYFVVLGVLLFALLLVLSRSRGDRLRAAVFAALVALSGLAFPAYRYTVIGEFFLPNLDFVEPRIKSMALPGLTPAAENALRELPLLPSVVSIDTLRTRLITYEESIELSRRMLASGQSKGTVRSTMRRVGGEMIDGLFLQNMRFSLTAIGFVAVPYLGDPAAPGQLYMPVRELKEHQQFYYKWFGWTQGESYRATFDSFILSYRQTPDLYAATTVDRLAAVLRANISDRPSWAKDPLRLSDIPLDVFIAAWALFVIVMLVRAPGMAAIFALPVAIVFIACVSVPIGSIRYAQPLVPFYIFGTSFVVGWLVTRARTTFTKRDRP